MRYACGLALWCAAVTSAADNLELAPTIWDRPRTARVIYEQSAIRQALELYLAKPNVRLVIHHAPTRRDAAQAEELRIWLMALAVDSSRIQLVDDLSSGRPLEIEATQ